MASTKNTFDYFISKDHTKFDFSKRDGEITFYRYNESYDFEQLAAEALEEYYYKHPSENAGEEKFVCLIDSADRYVSQNATKHIYHVYVEVDIAYYASEVKE